MNYLDLLGSKFVLFSLGLFGVACAAGDPVDSPHHTEPGSAGSSGLNTGSTTGGTTGSTSGSGGGNSSGTGTSTGSGSGTGGSSAGSSNTGSSGSMGSAGSSGVAGSTGVGTPISVDSTFAMNGYGDNGTWKGYAFTTTFPPPPAVTTATITPICPLPCFSTAVKKLCVSGSVKADSSNASGASLGWNINQAAMMPNPVQTLATTGSGITVDVPGATTTMRVQISAGTTQWCAPVPAGGKGTIKWTDFKTKCWDGSGTAYPAATPIEAIQIVVPSAIAEVPFSFCLASAAIAP